MISLEKTSRELRIDRKVLSPVSKERNKVGICQKCDHDLESLAYYKTDLGWFVCCTCQNNHSILLSFDFEWNWLEDSDIEIIESKAKISSIPKEKLEQVFTGAEIRDMLAYEQGKPFVRQNLYRARAKFERFWQLFGFKINI